jgi:hypothetical protein
MPATAPVLTQARHPVVWLRHGGGSYTWRVGRTRDGSGQRPLRNASTTALIRPYLCGRELCGFARMYRLAACCRLQGAFSCWRFSRGIARNDPQRPNLRLIPGHRPGRWIQNDRRATTTRHSEGARSGDAWGRPLASRWPGRAVSERPSDPPPPTAAARA